MNQNLNKLFETGLLKKIEPNKDMAKKSIKQAEFFLKESHDLINLKKYEISTLSLYNSFFHAARALLFLDGIKERSHYAVARYIEEKYVKTNKINIKLLSALDSIRDTRHEVQYSLNLDLDYDIQEYFNLCEELIKTIKQIVRK